jgi:hypothetical protein
MRKANIAARIAEGVMAAGLLAMVMAQDAATIRPLRLWIR